ncbi:MAG: hypothetical protein GF331_25415 [Chitinivibrionales bacterium]|nr:hypothetical protein [Chitinivibrionales bacterium]
MHREEAQMAPVRLCAELHARGDQVHPPDSRDRQSSPAPSIVYIAHMPPRSSVHTAFLLGGIALWSALLGQAVQADEPLGNTIRKNTFNFGHQLGYMYARSETARFRTAGTWRLVTGAFAYYTREMPLVRNPAYEERLMVLIPLHFEYSPCDNVLLDFDLTDLFVEVMDYRRTGSVHYLGGKSPRFRTKVRLLPEGRFLPCLALTVGVKWSSAKPFTIWDHRHNYDQSNGLAGAGTGEADYVILLAASKAFRLLDTHCHIGLLPLGSPVEYSRGSGQMDEMLYGLTVDILPDTKAVLRLSFSGMYNFLDQGALGDYAVIRANLGRRFRRVDLIANIEAGLTNASDDLVVGLMTAFEFAPRRTVGVSKHGEE